MIAHATGEVVNVDSPTLLRPLAGDVLDVYSTGGGGYGDPRERPVEAVMADVRARLLSVEKAREAYGVVVDPQSLQVDVEATRVLRDGAGANQDADGDE